MSAAALVGLDSMTASAVTAGSTTTAVTAISHKANAPKHPKVTVMKVTATGIAVPTGTKVNATIRIANTYSVRKPADDVRLYLQHGEKKYRLAGTRVKSLASGASTTIRATRTVPLSAPAGKYSVVACRGLHEVEKCRTSAATVTIAPALLSATSSVLFGDVAVGSVSTPHLVTVTNNGHATTGGLLTTAVGNRSFSVTASTCVASLSPGASCSFSIAFAPNSASSLTGSVDVSASRANPISIAVSGNGTGAAALAISKSTHTFVDTPVGSASVPVELTVTNTGNLPTGTPSVNLVPAAARDYTITANSCDSALAPAATCTVGVAFTPTTRGRLTAALSISATPGSSVSTALSGTGLASASLGITPDTLTFGNELVGSTTTTQTITVTNGGDIASGVPAVTVDGADAGQFTIVQNDCTVALAAAASCDVTVAFAPSSPGTASASLIVTGIPGGQLTAALGGVGQAIASLAISETSYNFGYSDSPAEHIFTVTNNGDAASGAPTVDVDGDSAFEITSDTCTTAVEGDSSCTVGVTYSGSGSTEQSATVSIASSPGGTVGSDLTGSPLALTVEPSSHDYGGILVGDTSDSASYTVTNHRLASVQVDSEGVTGPFPLDTSCFAQIIAAGATCSFSAHFAPTAAGPATGSLIYFAQGAQAEVALSGTGLTPAAFSVSTSTVNFGAYVPGDAGTQQVTITNTGTQASEPTEVSITGPDASQFHIDGGTTCSAILAGGASCTVDVAFTPTTLGDKSGTLTVGGAPGGTAALIGLGAPAGVTLYPATYDYGSVAVGSSKSFVFRVVNTSDSGQNINSVSSGTPFLLDVNQDFTCVLSVDTIQPHRWCTISIKFSPSSTGPFNKTLTAGGDGLNISSQMYGTGVTAPTSSQTNSRAAASAQRSATSVQLRDGEPVVSYK